MKMKLALLTIAFSLIVGPAFGWPWGNVGIGTTGMPEEKLHVVGNVRVDDGFIILGGVTNRVGSKLSAIIGHDAIEGAVPLKTFISAFENAETWVPTGVWHLDTASGDARMTAFYDNGFSVYGIDQSTTSVVVVLHYSLTED